jgi:hypothetical protein
MNQSFICKIGSDEPDIKIGLIDQSTYMMTKCNKYHTKNTHLIFCILFRIILGLLIFNNKISNISIIILSIIILIFFGNKYLFNKPSWKNYMKIELIYGIILLQSLIKPNNQFIGSLIIFDSILSQSSRFYI